MNKVGLDSQILDYIEIILSVNEVNLDYIEITWLQQNYTAVIVSQANIDTKDHTWIIHSDYNKITAFHTGVVGWCEGAVYLTSPGRPTDIGLQLGKACYPCSG